MVFNNLQFPPWICLQAFRYDGSWGIAETGNSTEWAAASRLRVLDIEVTLRLPAIRTEDCNSVLEEFEPDSFSSPKSFFFSLVVIAWSLLDVLTQLFIARFPTPAPVRARRDTESAEALEQTTDPAGPPISPPGKRKQCDEILLKF